jgi:dipeptidyl aminopeptidase/acylaminoacyl peptidase
MKMDGTIATWMVCAGLCVVGGSLSGCKANEPTKDSAGTSSSASARGGVAVAPAAEESDLLERFIKIRTPGAATLAADGTLFVRDLPDGVYQIYRYPSGVAALNVTPERLTDFKDGASGYSLSHDGSRLIITAAVGGNENTQIYTLDPKAPAGTALTAITTKPTVQYSPNLWLPDSSGLIFTGNDDSPTDFFIYKHDFRTGARSTLLSQEGSWSASAITADGSRLLVSRYFSASNSTVFELAAATGELKDLSILPPSAGDAQTTASCQVVGYMPGEQAVLITSDAENGLRSLYQRDLSTGTVTKLLRQFDGREVDEVDMNLEKTLLSVVLNVDGYGQLHLFELPGLREVVLPKIEPGVVGGISMRGRQLTWTLNNARTPGLTFVATVPERSSDDTKPLTIARAKQITFTDTQGIDLQAFALPELIRYKAFDGVEIPAYVFLPAGHKKGTPLPFVVNYHGGPEGQHRPVFSAAMQYLLSQGFGVMMPNVRGSTGYGRAFHMMDDYKKRWDSVRDGVDAAKWLVEKGYSMPGEIATFGGSYGGFMSVACLVEDQERVERGEQKQRFFGAGVDNVGIVNMKTFLEQTSGYRRKLREVEYGPLTDPEFLASVSPLNKIDKIKVPMLISHGLNDPRVPVGEAMQLAVGLQRRGFNPEQVYFADEGHGAQKIENRLLYMERVTKFLEGTIRSGR